MKQIHTLFALLPGMAFGQSLVYTTPQNRTAMLEDFTGIHCGYCPDGHAILAALEAANGEDLVGVGVHANIYAVPSGTEPDFRTTEGTAIDAFFGPSGYPSGVINRHAFAGGTALSRGAWEGAVNEVLALPSPVNVGVESSFDGTDLTVHVQAYYTANSPAGNDFISVLVKENHITGWQTDYANGNQPNYDHLHVLRAYITELWGEDVGDHAAGELVDRTYTYTVPSTWNMANCEVVAFVSEYQSEVYQVRSVAANGGTTLVVGSLQSDPQPYVAGTNAATTTFTGTFANGLGADEEYVITLNSYGSPVSWANGFTVDGVAQSNPATVSIAGGNTVAVDVQVTPDATPGIGKYTLTVSSLSNPGAPVLEAEYHVISGVHDLVVTNPQAEPHEEIYVNGLLLEPTRAVTTRADFTAFGAAGALTDVLNLYLNISWTFPSLTDEVVNVLADFMDNGGNLMIAGQDIGWDQSGVAGSYGTAVTQAFYQDYLLATYVADGTSADATVNFEDADPVFGALQNTTISNVFANNTYPDQITPIAPAVPIMRYSAVKIGGLRAQTSNYKVVYFGIGPEQVANATIAEQMVSLSHDWFYGTVGVEQFDAAMNALGQAFPSPADAYVIVPVGIVTGTAVLEVTDATGRMVHTEGVTTTSSTVTVNTSQLRAGMYSARLRGKDGTSKARTFMVAR